MSELDPFARSDGFWLILGVGAFLLALVSVAIVIVAARERRVRRGVVAAVLAAAFYLECQLISKNCSIARGTDAADDAAAAFLAIDPTVLTTANLLALAVLAILVVRIALWERQRITPASIKEAIDSLPMGICCCTSEGMVVMVNRAMEKLHWDLFGDVPVDGTALLPRLAAGQVASGCQMVSWEPGPAVRTAGGRVWSFSERGITFAGRDARLIRAVDMTELFEKTADLDAKRHQLAAAGERLAAVNREVVALAAAREVLEAKVRLHDEFGESLLGIRRAFADTREGRAVADVASLAERLCQSLEVLRKGVVHEPVDEYALILETAANLGVSVDITGALPEAHPQKHIVATAIHECLTNTIRHAHGTRLSCEAAEVDGAFVLTLANDGDVPREPIAERGGLHTLRTMVESAGGAMLITVDPRFTIRIIVPKEVSHDL